MYDKDEINSIAILYSVDPTEENLMAFLKAMTPMVDVVLLRHPKVVEHKDDLRQELLLKLWLYCKEPGRLGRIFNRNVPADYLFFKLRIWAHRQAKKIVGMYDMYNPFVVSIEELTAEEKASIGIDPLGEDFDEWS